MFDAGRRSQPGEQLLVHLTPPLRRVMEIGEIGIHDEDAVFHKAHVQFSQIPQASAE